MQISQESISFGVFFNKIAGLQNCNFLKKRLQLRFFPVNLSVIQEHQLWRGPIDSGLVLKNQYAFLKHLFYRTSPVAASDSFSFPACNFVKKEARAKMFICEFCKIFKNIFWRNDCFNLQTTASCVYLQFLRSFSDHSFYRTPLGNCLFPLQVVKFQPPHRVKKYFTSSFKSFYTRRYANSYSKAFMHLEPLIIICEEVNL